MKHLTWQHMLLALLVMVCAALPAAAQETPAAETASTSLSYNTPVSGAIDSAIVQQDWQLQTISADRIQVRVERADGNLVPSVSLLDASGVELNNSYGAQETHDSAQIDSFALPAAGSYTIRVTRDRGVDGTTAGGYQLTVIPLATAADNINNTTVIAPIMADTPIAGEITATHWLHRYTYSASAADTIRVRAVRSSGTLQPEVELLDSNGTILTTGYTESEGNRAELERTLDAPGDYTVIVRRTRGFDGVTIGGYALSLEITGSGEGSANLAGIAGDVVYDTPLTGEITGTRWYQDWRLTAAGADSLRVVVTRANPTDTLLPEVVLLGAGGQEIQHGYTDYDGATAEIIYTLETPGEYIVRVTRSSGQTGRTFGAYNLTVSLIGAGEGSAPLQGATGSIEFGATVEGQITPLRWEDTWTFAGQPEQRIVVTVRRTGGNLVPEVDLRDANGQSLRYAYVENTNDTAIIDYTLPAASEYRIVVTRQSNKRGLTTGSYALTVGAPAE